MSTHPTHRSRRFPPARYIPIYLSLLLLPVVAGAQSAGKITGTLRDAETHAPLKSATVMLRDPADSLAKPLGDLSDGAGAFSIERVVIGRRYRLEVRFIGYQTYVDENVIVTADRPVLDVGEIDLRPGSVEGREVQITSERPMVSVQPDKTVYAVENNPAYTATNVSELLAQTPSVSVDQDGKISLRGNENVTIMMNDRPLTMPADQRNKFLQSLPASSVKDIEIRTNPGAQFDAKNQGGIINIVTRRTMSDMFGGNVNGGIDTRLGTSGGAGLYYNGKDLTASLGGGLFHGPNHGVSSSLRLNYLDTNERRDQGTGISESVSNSGYGYGQIDYNLSEKDLVSFSFNLNHWSSNYSMDNAHALFNINDLVVETINEATAPGTNGGNAGGYNSASLLLKHTFSHEHKLSLDVTYNANGYSGDFVYGSEYFRGDGGFDSARSSSSSKEYDQSTRTLITTLDYEDPLAEKLKLSLGGKNEINSLDNNTSVRDLERRTGEWVLDTLQSNHYLPINRVYALYGNIAYSLGDALRIQGGLRLERANVSASYASGQSIISRDYTNLFPSGSVAYSITDRHSLTFSYRRSIALPDIDALNPVRVKWSDFLVNSGNPDLEPEFTQTFELSYNTFWGEGNMISLAPYYATTMGSIESSQQQLGGVTYASYANFNGAYSTGAEMSFSLKPLSWLNIRASGDVYRKVNRGGGAPGDFYSAAAGYNGNGTLSADLLEGTTFSVNIYANHPAVVGGSHQSGYAFWSFALRQRLLDKKLTLSLRLNDPFNLQKWQNSYDSPEFHTESTNKWTSRYLGLNISYTFGTTPRLETHRQERTETKGGSGSGGGGGTQGGGGS